MNAAGVTEAASCSAVSFHACFCPMYVYASVHDFATVWYRPVVSTRSSSLQRVPCRQVLDECSWRDRSSIVHQRECKIIDLLCWNSTSKLPDCECAVLEQCPAGQYSGTNVLSCIRCSAGKYLTNAAGITEGASCSTVSFRELECSASPLLAGLL